MIWCVESNYILYSDSAGIKIYEIDEVAAPNIYKIYKAPATKLFLDEGTLYFKSNDLYYSLDIIQEIF